MSYKTWSNYDTWTDTFGRHFFFATNWFQIHLTWQGGNW